MTEAFVARTRLLMAACCKAADAGGAVADTVAAFERLFEVLGPLNEGEVAYFPDEPGVWQLALDWKVTSGTPT